MSTSKPKVGQVGQVWQYCGKGRTVPYYIVTWLLLENRDKEKPALKADPLYEGWDFDSGEIWKIYHLEDNIIRTVCILNLSSSRGRLGWKKIG